MKHKLLVTSFTVLSACTLMACSHTTKKDTAASSTKESSSKVEKKTSSSSSKDTSSTHVVKESTKSSSKVEKEISDSDKGDAKTKRIGSADYGYLNIPSDWEMNDSIQVGDNIQYTDKNAFNIIVLNAATREKANVPEGVEFNAEMMAQRFETRWNDPKLVEKMTRSTTTVGGNESLKIHIFLKSGLQVAGWVFQKDDKVYLIVVEGFEKTITQFTPYVEDTWSLDGTGAVTD